MRVKIIREYIKKVEGGFKATSKSGRPLSKKVQTKKEAGAQVRAVHASKKARGELEEVKLDGVEINSKEAEMFIIV